MTSSRPTVHPSLRTHTVDGHVENRFGSTGNESHERSLLPPPLPGHDDYFLFVLNGLVVTSNVDRLPRKRGFRQYRSFEDRIWETGWYSRNFPYLAYVPRNDCLPSPLFECLNVDPSDPGTFTVISGERLSVRSDVVAQWRALETALWQALQALMAFGGPLWDGEYRHSPAPREMGYDKVHADRKSAEAAAARSRMAFYVRVAHCLSLVAAASSSCPGRAWLDALQQSPLPRTWVDGFRDFAARCFGSPGSFVGSFILPDCTHETPAITHMFESQVPIWLVWAREDSTGALVDHSADDATLPLRRFATYNRLMVNQAAISAARASQTPVRICGDGSFEVLDGRGPQRPTVLRAPENLAQELNEPGPARQDVSESAMDSSSTPSLDLASQPAAVITEGATLKRAFSLVDDNDAHREIEGGIPGETMGESFARRIRLSEESDDDRTTHLRQKLALKDVADAEKRPDAEAVEDRDSHETDAKDYDRQKTTTPLASAQSGATALTQFIFQLPDDRVDTYVYNRLGFVASGLSAYDPQAHVDLPGLPGGDIDTVWSRLKSVLGFREVGDSTDPSVRPAVIDFIRGMKCTAEERQLYPNFPQSYMFDLRPDCPSAFDVGRSKYFALELKRARNSAKTVWYLLQPRDNSTAEGWTLATTSASIAVQILREDLGPTPASVAHTLASRGMPFSTLRRIPIASIVHNASLCSHESAAIRPPGHIVGREDYMAYKAARKHLILNTDVGRLCILQGGFLARLAREDGLSEDIIADFRPADSSDVVEHLTPAAIAAAPLASGTDVLVDRTLTEDEVRTLIGAISVSHPSPPSAKSEKTANDSNSRPGLIQLSFWPHISYWDASGANYNAWMPRNEEFYCFVRNNYEDAVAREPSEQELERHFGAHYADGAWHLGVRTHRAWKSAMSGDSVWKRARNYHEEQAAAYLFDRLGSLKHGTEASNHFSDH